MQYTLNLQSIDKRPGITQDTFLKEYYYPLKPVILPDFSKNWVARDNWTFDYFKQHHGDLTVPIYSEAFANNGSNYMSAQEQMRFGDYLELIQHEPSHKRMFLYNILKHVPTLCQDFDYPAYPPKFMQTFPFMFFGGASSWVDAHYDADMSHVFITQFAGKKRILLYSPDQSRLLYRHPFTVSANIDIGKPDFKQYPRLQDAQGYECILEHGQTLFMPSGYWHYIYYLDGSFSLSLRAPANNLYTRAVGLKNIFNLTVVDRGLNKLIGNQRWYDWKEQIAQYAAKNAN